MDRDMPQDTDDDRSEAETEVLQDDQRGSAALDQDIDASKVKLLPGTGGPDDDGDIDYPEP